MPSYAAILDVAFSLGDGLIDNQIRYDCRNRKFSFRIPIGINFTFTSNKIIMWVNSTWAYKAASTIVYLELTSVAIEKKSEKKYSAGTFLLPGSYRQAVKHFCGAQTVANGFRLGDQKFGCGPYAFVHVSFCTLVTYLQVSKKFVAENYDWKFSRTLEEFSLNIFSWYKFPSFSLV